MAAARILVVEDNALNYELAEAILERAGYAVMLAADGEAGLAAARRDRPDLILMDIELPRLDGLTATRTLKADPSTAAIPIIALTAYAMAGDEERIRAAGCDDYATKPIDREALLAAIARCLHAAGHSSVVPS